VAVGVNTLGPSDEARDLAALRRLNPEQWRSRVRSALSRAKGHIKGEDGAAALLGVHAQTLFRWLRDDRELSKVPTAPPGRAPEERQNKVKQKKNRGVRFRLDRRYPSGYLSLCRV